MMIDRISNFRMVRIVSEGERGAFLHAVSEKSGERVAVRVIRGAAATAELEQRCLRAVQVSRLFSHPAVVRLIQAGRLPDGSVYQIQEQLLGETLAARLAARARLPMNEVLRLGRQIATVLATAHSRGISHRALRPEAVQLVPDPEAIGGERVKLNDWGLAFIPAQAESPAEAPPTPLDMPTYLAPEQCRAAAAGDDKTAPSEPADVYALGVLLFQLASGHPPFAGRPVSEIIAMHLAALPPKLDAKIVAMPSGLPALVAAMLIKDPKARPTMHEVEERLLQLLAQHQLAQTLTPASQGNPDELLRALPSMSATIQVRSAAGPGGSAPSPRRLWAAGILLSLLFVAGLWWLFMPLFGGSSAEQTLAAQAVPVVPIDSLLAEARVAPAAPATASPHAAKAGPVISTPVVRGGRASFVSYPPLRDARAVALARGKRPMPPLRDGNASALPTVWQPSTTEIETPVVLLAAQTAFASGDYERAIAGATSLLAAQPAAAALLLGKSACAVGDLELAKRSYQSLRPAARTALIAWCKQHSIELAE